MLTLAWPWLLLALPLPWLIRKRRKNNEEGRNLALRVPFYQQAARVLEGADASSSSAPSGRWSAILQVLAWTLLVVAVCRPQWQGEPIPMDYEARDLLLAVDISPSMQETDLQLKGNQATRLDVVKSVVTDFIQVRQGDRLGLILFGAQPYIQAPLTYDLVTVGELLNEATLGIAGNATAIGDAIGLGIKRLRERPADSRVLVLLTDGANTGGEVSPEQAAKLAADAGIKIYTVGVGADEIIRRGIFGYRKENPSADLDETLLQSIADETDGQYFRARNTGELELIYESINQLEPIKQQQRFFRPTTEWYWGPLLVALILLAFCWLVPALSGLSRRSASTQLEEAP
ncbi:uncharacterized protein containing a von Willebrand factor type A (vWA) domain [Hahella chejuensis KCTC 2396]|uniref:Uncharacterized protein containing a von Willebrand factor type A (VWA) domain n=1 Tax=Hahella chejuensis (strain KCTC 2396) TaxID=349521 RepID=Q2SCZ7_HAHCH|nr:VWA domain-containing protein [Hahella chejuensis]ABC31477.1 uncharacterized protein containing a von Willebrand factor type A (vWA) domain [Hahella chejuensis KCTC 2396]